MGIIRVLLLLAVVGGAFVGGFYTGTQYREEELRKHPQEFIDGLQEELEKTARDKYERIKNILLE